MRQLATALEVLGALLVVIGVALVYVPAGLVVAGVFALIASYLLAEVAE